MKRRAIVALLLGVVLVGAAACSGRQTGTTQELVKVARGDLAVTVSGSGDIEVPNDQKLTFDTAGKIDRVYVKEGDRIHKGAPVVSLTTEAQQLAVKQAEAGLAQAQAGVVQAQAALKAAEYALNLSLNQYTMTQIEAAQTDVDEAKAYVQYITTNMATAMPDQQPLWANALVYAQAKLAAAEVRLNALVGNYDTEEVAIKRLQADAARQALAAAEQAAALADQTLTEAKRQLDGATLVAAFDGVVGRLNVKAGDAVSPVVVVAEIIDPSEMRLKVQVDEIDIASVKMGQTASLQMDAAPALKITGNVTAIALLPTLQTGVVTYDATVSFTPPPDSGLRVGMSATADIIIARRTGVLLVPERAIGQNSQGQTVVKVQANGKTEDRVVVVGITDGIQTEIVSGLSEGETVVVERAAQQSGGFF